VTDPTIHYIACWAALQGDRSRAAPVLCAARRAAPLGPPCRRRERRACGGPAGDKGALPGAAELARPRARRAAVRRPRMRSWRCARPPAVSRLRSSGRAGSPARFQTLVQRSRWACQRSEPSLGGVETLVMHRISSGLGAHACARPCRRWSVELGGRAQSGRRKMLVTHSARIGYEPDARARSCRRWSCRRSRPAWAAWRRWSRSRR